ncbi:MAG TPA: hypothetical protein VGS07_18735 [Thermoanaerobaculia bacterium]|jgi:hypothetical protein|nr:hypothetical protein [Thermoanaerobaculia bacterium]
MSISPWDWPALDLQEPAPRRLEVEWAVWGKVHGAASDYRWIAHSPGFDPQAQRLQPELLVGGEDAPASATCWRALAGSFCAVSCYPSRAMDASRRSGFLEKQLLLWRPPAAAPAALGALLLLPRVARSTDRVWWDSSADPGWSRPDFALVLKPEEAAPVEDFESELQRNAEAGLAALREAVGEESVLADFYSALLAGQRPAILGGLARPLSPEGLAALLLPLPREVADRLSVAGWLLSQRVDAESFRRLWDVLVCDRPPAALRTASPAGVTEQGREAARAVFAAAPQRLRSQTRSWPAGAVVGAAPRIPPEVERLQNFATDSNRRWLAPEELAGGSGRLLRAADGWDRDLVACIEAQEAEVEKLRREQGILRWQREHLQAKADLLRAAALALAPAVFSRLDPPKSKRVPALLYCVLLAEQDWSRLAALGEAKLREMVRQSLDCRPDLQGGALRAWLARWGSRMKMSWLAPLLEASQRETF